MVNLLLILLNYIGFTGIVVFKTRITTAAATFY